MPGMKPPVGYEEVQRFYGWRDAYIHDLDTWGGQMVLVPPPAGCVFYYDADADGDLEPGERSRGVRVHPLLRDEVATCFQLVQDAGLWHFLASQAGGYTFRMQRGSTSKLSMHCFGAAVDFDPFHNKFKAPPELTALGTQPGLGVVRIFEARGWTWGGRWGRPDAMHFQFATGV